MPRNPVVRAQIANPKRNAGRHQDRREVRRQDPIAVADEAHGTTLCEECGKDIVTGMICPDGAFVCEECFDKGAH